MRFVCYHSVLKCSFYYCSGAVRPVDPEVIANETDGLFTLGSQEKGAQGSLLRTGQNTA